MDALPRIKCHLVAQAHNFLEDLTEGSFHPLTAAISYKLLLINCFFLTSCKNVLKWLVKDNFPNFPNFQDSLLETIPLWPSLVVRKLKKMRVIFFVGVPINFLDKRNTTAKKKPSSLVLFLVYLSGWEIINLPAWNLAAKVVMCWCSHQSTFRYNGDYIEYSGSDPASMVVVKHPVIKWR